MQERFAVQPTGDENSGVDGVPFVATLNGVRTGGFVSRSVLSAWAHTDKEPLVNVFLDHLPEIEAAARLKLAVGPGMTIVLGSADF